MDQRMSNHRLVAGLREVAMAPFTVVRALTSLGPASTGLTLVILAGYALLVAGAPPEGLTPDYLSSRGGNDPTLVLAGQVWRLLSYALLHASILHLAMNSLPLFVVGGMLNIEFGSLRLVGLFVVGVVCGGIAHVALGGAEVVSVGASGGVFALAGALVVLAIRRHPMVGRRSLAFDLPVMAATSLIPGVDWQGHAGGFAAGVALTLLMTGGTWSPRFRLRGDRVTEAAA